MKKPKKPKAGKSKRKEQTPQQPRSKLEKTRSTHRTILKMAEWILGPPAALFGVIAGIYSVWGPIWPTEPAFAVTRASSASAWDVPFLVTNSSALFPIKDLEIECVLVSAVTKNQNTFEDAGFGILARSVLAPGETRPYTCPLNRLFRLGPDDPPVAAKIKFVTEYASRLPWKTHTQATSGIFTLNAKTSSPQWMQGEPLP